MLYSVLVCFARSPYEVVRYDVRGAGKILIAISEALLLYRDWTDLEHLCTVIAERQRINTSFCGSLLNLYSHSISGGILPGIELTFIPCSSTPVANMALSPFKACHLLIISPRTIE